MKRTDDFLADLETQLGAAAAGRVRRRRRPRPGAVLRPALVAVVAAAAVMAFVVADGTRDPERATDPAPPRDGAALITLPGATQDADCGLERRVDGPPPADLLSRFAVLRRERTSGDRLPPGVTAPGLEEYVRSVEQGPRAWLVPSNGVSPEGCGGAVAPGVCIVVELQGERIACFTSDQIEGGRAAASLGPSEPGSIGFMVMVVPDGIEQVEFVPRSTRASNTFGINGNSIVADLNGVEPGQQVLVDIDGGAGCHDHVLDIAMTPPARELLSRLPLLEGGTDIPRSPTGLRSAMEDIGGPVHVDHVRRALVFDDGPTVYLVPYASADPDQQCLNGVPLDKPLTVGPGACLVATEEERVVVALCRSLAAMQAGAMLEQGQMVLGFPPDGAARASGGAGAAVVEIQLGGGVLAGDTQGATGWSWEIPTARTTVLNGTSTAGVAADVQNRLERAGFDVKNGGDYPDQPRATSMVLYAEGHAATAERVARELGVKEVAVLTNLSQGIRARVGEVDVIVVAGADLTR